MSITPRDPADFTPTMGNYTELKPFRFWCQKVLPLVYDDTLSYYELLCKVVDFLNKTMEDVETLEEDVTNLHTAYVELQEYVNTYFSSLDVQTEIDNKLDAMAENGSLSALIEPFIPDLVSQWLEDHITPTSPVVDDTLSIEGAAADAKATGAALLERLLTQKSVIGSNYPSFFPDADNINTNSMYRLNFAIGATAIPLHLPYASWKSNKVASFYSFVTTSGEHSAGDVQMFVDSTGVFIRNYTTVWNSWTNVDAARMLSFNTIVGGNYQSVLPDANNITENVLYRLNYAVGATSIPANLPVSVWESKKEAILISAVSNSGTHTAGDYQIFIDSENVYVRDYGTAWTAWMSTTDKYIESNSILIGSGNYASLLPDANNITDNIVYRLNFTINNTSIPLNLPYTAWKSSRVATLISLVNTKGSHTAGDVQIFISSEDLFIRNYTTVWSDWISINLKYVESFTTLVGGNYSYLMPDADNVSKNVVYRMNFAIGNTSIPANLPYLSWKSSCVALFFSFVTNTGTHTAGDVQMFIDSSGLYIRNYTTTWTAWTSAAGKGREIIVDVNGSGDYTSFTAGLKEAVKTKGSILKVKKGTYDIIAEYKALYGNNYFTNFSYPTGVVFADNDVHIIGEYGAILKAEFDTPLTNVADYFSPIDVRFDCAIENLTVIAKNCRYCIHDDQWDRTTPYKHTFKNLILKCDNANNSLWSRRLAFGGGLGAHGIIEFDCCYFESTGISSEAFTKFGVLGYHNSPVSGQSLITVKNCYFANNGTFRFTYMGESPNTQKSLAYVSGCELGQSIEIEAENTSATIVNVEVIECNNKYR